jgi:CubicO group peptidase (beta-lactamase class C family)
MTWLTLVRSLGRMERRIPLTRRRRTVGVAAVLLLALTGCSDDDEEPAAAPPDAERSETTTPPTSTATTVGAATTGAYPSAITDEVVDGSAFDAMEQRLTSRIQQVGLPGASLLVVHEGELVEQEAWLDYDLDTVVPIASGSKWLAAATIMTVVDEGLIDLDAPIADYVPEAAGTPPGAITMRQLLSFTSGLIADERVPCTTTGAGTLQECARAIVEQGVVHPPGEAFRYGSQHLRVAAAVAEVVTGVPFAELFQQRIAEPLGMTRTRFNQIGDTTTQVEPVTNTNPAGGALSSLGDYARFLEMLVHDGVAPDGTRILSEAALEEMRTNHTEDVRYATASSFRVATEGPYALGNWIDWTDAEGGTLVQSSDGAFGFRPWIDEVNDLFGVYLIEDRGEGYVEGDPEAVAGEEQKVHTSGLFVFEWVAEAVGGSLPEQQYPHRG